MKTFKTIEVHTYSNPDPIKISLPVKDGAIEGKQLMKALASLLGLQPGSLKCFSVFDGHHWPHRLFRESDTIPVEGTQLSFQRWCFNPKLADTIVDKDAAAGSLLYHQAVHIVHSGRLPLNKEDEAKLEEYSSPDFTLMRDYIRVCEAQPSFLTYTFPDCVLVTSVNLPPHLEFEAGSKLTLAVDKTGIKLTSYRGRTKNCLVNHWSQIQAWSLHMAKKHLTFDIVNDRQTSEPMSLTLETERCQFVIDVIKAVIQQIQVEDPKCPKFYIDMVTQGTEGSTHWQNALYNYNKSNQ